MILINDLCFFTTRGHCWGKNWKRIYWHSEWIFNATNIQLLLLIHTAVCVLYKYIKEDSQFIAWSIHCSYVVKWNLVFCLLLVRHFYLGYRRGLTLATEFFSTCTSALFWFPHSSKNSSTWRQQFKPALALKFINKSEQVNSQSTHPMVKRALITRLLLVTSQEACKDICITVC